MLTPDKVAARVNGQADDPDVISATEAANAFVESACPDAPRTYDADGNVTGWGKDTYLGALMYAARLVRLRNSPSGTQAFADGSAVFTPRLDPDTAQLLRLGSFAPPRVG